MAARVCECGATIPPPKGRGRARMKCEDCSPRKIRPRRETVTAIREPSDEPPTLVAATLTKLRGCNRHESPEGILALQLAHDIGSGGHSAAGLASLSKAYRDALDAAVKGAPRAADAVDELMERRRRRVGA